MSPARREHPEAGMVHYIDDLLIAARTEQELQKARDSVIAEVQKAGLEISTSEIQEVAPWRYLGWKITEQTIRPQKIQIRTEINTLQDLQQLLGEINWMRPILGIMNYQLSSLFNLLRGDCNIKSPRTLTPEAQKSLEKITESLQQRQAHHFVMICHFSLRCWEKRHNCMDFFSMGLITERSFVDFGMDFSILQISKNNSYRFGDVSANRNQS